jgi:hypothetical protein
VRLKRYVSFHWDRRLKVIIRGSGAIRLRHGDEAIIRNNRIMFKDIATRRAVTTIDTGEFGFSGNTVEGAGSAKVLVVSLQCENTAKVVGTRFID